jgi:site-specific recombinase XerD
MNSFEEFGRYLAEQGRDALTVAGYTQDLALFARWFEHTNGEPLTPTALTLTDAREYRQHLLRHKAKPATTPAFALRASAVQVSTATWPP